MHARLDTTPVATPTWLASGHLETIYASLVVPGGVAASPYIRERITTSDNDFIDLDWTALGIDSHITRLSPANFKNPPRLGLVIFHGLEGNSSSHYARTIAQYFRARNWLVALPHFRGCSGTPNRLPRSYHAGDITDMPLIFQTLQERFPEVQWYAAGISLGGNALLKFLAQAPSSITAAAALSAPLDLKAAGYQLDQGIHRILYTKRFLRTLKRKVYQKSRYYPGFVDLASIMRSKTLYEFDNHYTAPIHGFKNVLDYWERSSSKPDLPHIRIPTLVLNSKNDPFLPAHSLPTIYEASSSVLLHQPATGGHVGFVTGSFPGHLRWLPKRLETFFTLNQ